MAKAVKDSPFTRKDPIAETQYGEGAVHFKQCRVIVRGGDKVSIPGGEAVQIGFSGVTINGLDPTNGDGRFQLWDCEVVLIPRAKFRGESVEGHTLGSILTEHDFSNPEKWDEEIFKKN